MIKCYHKIDITLQLLNIFLANPKIKIVRTNLKTPKMILLLCEGQPGRLQVEMVHAQCAKITIGSSLKSMSCYIYRRDMAVLERKKTSFLLDGYWRHWGRQPENKWYQRHFRAMASEKLFSDQKSIRGALQTNNLLPGASKSAAY